MQVDYYLGRDLTHHYLCVSLLASSHLVMLLITGLLQIFGFSFSLSLLALFPCYRLWKEMGNTRLDHPGINLRGGYNNCIVLTLKQSIGVEKVSVQIILLFITPTSVVSIFFLGSVAYIGSIILYFTHLAVYAVVSPFSDSSVTQSQWTIFYNVPFCPIHRAGSHVCPSFRPSLFLQDGLGLGVFVFLGNLADLIFVISTIFMIASMFLGKFFMAVRVDTLGINMSRNYNVGCRSEELQNFHVFYHRTFRDW